MVIGIYGLIGSGKSTMANYLKNEHNYVYLELDEIAKELLSKNKNLINDLHSANLPIFGENRAIDKQKLTNAIFNSFESNHAVSSIIWGYLKIEVEKIIKDLKKKGETNIVVEAAMLPFLKINGIDVYVKMNYIVFKSINNLSLTKHKTKKQIKNIIKIQKQYVKGFKPDYTINKYNNINKTYNKLNKIIN